MELHPEVEAANRSVTEDRQLSALAAVERPYEPPNREIKHHRGLNHMERGLSMVRNVASHPRRLRWVEFDQKVSRELLGKLTEFNGYLQELLYGHELRALEAATRRTTVEIV